jgi:hypothetical protein
MSPMPRLLMALTASLLVFSTADDVCGGNRTVDDGLRVDARDWPWWRGPNRDGTADANQSPPLTWSETEHVVWKAAIPGKGHGSPIVVGDEVLLQTAESDPESQSVVCLDRATGKLVWRKTLHEGGFAKNQNAKSTSANSTPACDGERIFVNFLNHGAVWTTALDRQGQTLWQKKITDYVLHQGFSSSPAIYQSLVLVSADNKGSGVLVGLNRETGDLAWKESRPALPNYTSPIILRVAGKDQALFIGCDLVTSLDPLTGRKLWETPGATTECVTSTVTDGRLIYTSGGYPKNHLAAVVADGSNHVAWENSTRVYVPSMVLKDGYLYAMLDAGVAQCWQADTGQEQWKHRVGGTFSSSLVLVGDRIYATDESGKTYVFAADPKEFRQLAENKLGDESFATPAICGGRIYHRAASNENGRRQEFLYCLGDDAP